MNPQLVHCVLKLYFHFGISSAFRNFPADAIVQSLDQPFLGM